MSRDNQIDIDIAVEEMACDMGRLFGCNESRDCAEIFARNLYNAGYRKSADVALEVIGEVVSKAKAIFCPDCDYDVAEIRYNLDWLEAELKKKYESEKDNGEI